MVGKGEHGFFQLQRLRNIFRVINHHKLPGGLQQAKITGARLRARLPFRHRHNLKMWRQVQRANGVAGLTIILFREEEDLQFIFWIGQFAHGLHKLGYHLRFLIKWAQDSIRRPIRVAQRVKNAHINFLIILAPESSQRQRDVEDQVTGVKQRDEGDSGNQHALAPYQQTEYPCNG